MKYELPKLDYSYEALEPTIDALTMETHHSKHHQGYIDKANAILEKYPNLADKTLEEIFGNIDSFGLEEADKKGLLNNGGGVINHNIFWQSMSPQKQVDENLEKEIEETFGSVDEFKTKFSDVAKTQFGSGWAWLVRNGQGKLEVYSLPNQETPYALGHTPIMNLDVWEHAYYLKYKNKRPDYVDAWWQVCKIIK